MRSPRRVLLPLAITFVAGVSAGACLEERSDRAAAEPPRLSEAEALRARRACSGYRDRVCGLAADDPARADDCRRAEMRLEALDLQLTALQTAEGLGDSDRRVVQAEARRGVKACIEDLARLR